MSGSRGSIMGPDLPIPMENYKAIGFLTNTGLDLLENSIAFMPALNVGPALVRQ